MMKTSLILHPNHLSIFIFLCSLTIKVSGNSTAKEFFKPSNSGANFSIPTNPEFSPENSTKQVVKAIVVASVVSLTIIFLLGCTIFLRIRKRNRTSQLDEEKISYKNKELGTLCCRRFSLNEIKTATNNFDADLKIGDGGFGTVYKGFIAGRETPVAVKVLSSASSQGPHEFWTEVETLSKLRNPNLVSLIGYCNDQRYMIIVYDYMAHGTLRDHLYGSKTQPLTWKQRLEICIGAARGLVYLHAAVEQGIIHRDVKTSNILLDENWVAKVSDFGLSRLGPESPSRSHVSTDVKGTFGYLDPGYYWTKELTPKSDVYGFGVVMFEVLCGRPAVDMGLEDEQQSLARWARYNVKKGTLDQIIDENLRGEISPECLKLYGIVADRCLRSERKRRPKMADVLKALEFALRLQESADGAAEEGIEIGEESTSDEKMTCWGNGGSQVVVRSTYKDDVVHSCPAMWKKSNSQRMLLRFFSDKVGLRWATLSTSRALIRALCFTCSCTLVKYPHGDGSKNEK